jgi:hypothetical protein
VHILHLSFRFYWIWKLAEAAFIGGLVGRANIISVNEVLPCGITKTTFPVLPVDPAAKLRGKVVSVVGALVVFPDFKRM